MGKKSHAPLTEELESYFEVENAVPSYVMFMAAKEGIKDALTKGWKARRIWAAMKRAGRINCAYSTFAHYVHTHIKEEKDDSSCNIMHDSMMELQGMPNIPEPDSSQAIVPATEPAPDMRSVYFVLGMIMENTGWIRDYLSRYPIC